MAPGGKGTRCFSLISTTACGPALRCKKNELTGQRGSFGEPCPLQGAHQPADSAFRLSLQGACKEPAPRWRRDRTSRAGGRGAESFLTLRGRGDRLSSAKRRKPTRAPVPLLLAACAQPSGGRVTAAGCGEGFKFRPHFPSGHPPTPLPSSPPNPKLNTTPNPHPAGCLRQDLKRSTLSPPPFPVTGWSARATGAAARRCVSCLAASSSFSSSSRSARAAAWGWESLRLRCTAPGGDARSCPARG